MRLRLVYPSGRRRITLAHTDDRAEALAWGRECERLEPVRAGWRYVLAPEAGQAGDEEDVTAEVCAAAPTQTPERGAV